MGDKALQIADSAIQASGKMIEDAKSDLDKGDESTAKMCLNLMQRGSEYISAIYSKTDAKEVIKLGKIWYGKIAWIWYRLLWVKWLT